MAADAKVGRGLQSILSRCAHAFTPADLHVFSVLARTLRFTAWDGESSGDHLHKLVSIYRGAAAEPISGGVRATYRVDVLPVFPNKDLGRVVPARCRSTWRTTGRWARRACACSPPARPPESCTARPPPAASKPR